MYNLFINCIFIFIFIFILLVFKSNLLYFNYFLSWLIIFIFIFWTFSTFNFFFKYYKYSKFISTIQRFWRRSFNIFWLVEFFWFIIFIYCLLTANHEPVQYEEVFIYKNLYLASLNIFWISIILLIFLIVLLYFIIIFIKYIYYQQIIYLFLFINFLILCFFFIELYQFLNIVSFFGETSWVYNYFLNTFEVNIEYWRFRPRLAFFSLVLLAKFWHCIFIIGSWFIFIIKSIENKNISISLLSMNYQNLIIFYLMSWIQLISWIKFYLKFLIKKLWFWFFINPTKKSLFIFYFSFIDYFKNFNNNIFFYYLNIINFKKDYIYIFNSSYYDKTNYSLTYYISNILY